jgi:uncharacterized damage-inducible protein DinB
MSELGSQFLSFSTAKLRQFAGRIETALGMLSDEQIWLRSGENSNAAGNLCLHLAGNVRQWIIHGVGGKPDIRVRAREFQARGGVSRAELLERLRSTVEEACGVIEACEPAGLLRTVRPQNYDVTVLEAIYHVVEHFAQHTGQILYATKALTGEDLGFYRHLNASGKLEPGGNPQA